MRVLLINSEYPPIGGGAGNASANLAQALVRRRVEVTVLTARFGDLPREEQQGGVRVVRLGSLRRRADRSGALEQGGFMVAGCLWAMRLVRRWRPDVVLAFFGVPGGAVALFLRLAFGLPYLVSLRGGDVPGFRPYDFATYHRLMGPLIRWVWRRARSVVANSDGLRQLAQAFDDRVAIELIPNGVDLQRYDVAAREWDPAQLLFVGRVVYQKGLDVLLGALADLQHLRWRLVIAGDGPLREALQAQAESLGVGERVRFAGWLSRDDLIPEYRKANLFVFPSRHEGMPNAVLEAMASGLPVIASRIAGNEELVLPGKTGLLVPVDDVAGLREALGELIPSGSKRAAMGAAGRTRVAEHYTWDQSAAAYQRLLEQAVRGS
jgi:glycosyltransferase involved in cell wall biosynthesis